MRRLIRNGSREMSDERILFAAADWSVYNWDVTRIALR